MVGITELERSQRKLKQRNFLKRVVLVGAVFVVTYVVSAILPQNVLAANSEQIKSSINKGSTDIKNLVTAISGGLALAILAGSFLFNMLPSQEISQKAKSVIFKVCISLFGISVSPYIVTFIENLGK